ncbi:serine hydrolase domain-containing protein [Jongsikchunia kroppenstedtii]|uniref:serine hydrolase domain-containing protein n=1 Tax=Jongsikchunia kroppenstedtii TaxID=1121721 RepID=UPI0003789AE5|nr:serine hydrolase domain-containing protein [Jongsikchunia kroppenstedtii]
MTPSEPSAVSDATVSGTCDPRFTAVRDALAANIQADEEVGAAIAVDIDGELVVDIWGGHRDIGRTQPWERDTIVNVWSTTKEVTALAVLMCVDRGLIDVDAPVAQYWPEFAAGGKEGILVRHLMSHSSGVSAWEQPFTIDDMYDWTLSTERLASQTPWWEPGTASGYHALNFGHLNGELVRRVTGKSLKEFVAAEIAGPLGVDLQIGAAESDIDRIAPVIPPPSLEEMLAHIPPDSLMIRTLTSPPMDAEAANTPAWRAADIGGANGHTNARALVRTLSLISRGSVGPLSMSAGTIDRIFDEQTRGPDLVLAVPLRFGIGFGLPEPATLPYLPDERICFWGGWGGSLTIMVPDKKTTISYVMNKMAPGIIGSDRAETYTSAIFAALE